MPKFKEGNNMGSLNTAGGAPENHRNATSHGLYSDPEKFLKGADEAERERILAIHEDILDRMSECTDELDEFDRSQAETLAVKTHIANRAGRYILENGLVNEDGEPGKIVNVYRRYTESVAKTAERMGISYDLETFQETKAVDKWREFVSNEAVTVEYDETLDDNDTDGVSEGFIQTLKDTNYTSEQIELLHEVESSGKDRIKVHQAIEEYADST